MDYKIKEETLTGIAEAIRSKTGKTEEILAADFAANINSIDTSKPEETKEVLLDFSGGDMEVVPTTGKVISKVTIPQPENLLPENIAEGIDIAGIIGALSGIKINGGYFRGTGSAVTIEHGLGVTPDFFVIFNFDVLSSTACLAVAAMWSKKFRELSNTTSYSGFYAKYLSSLVQYGSAADITTVSETMPISSATNTTVKVGGSSSGYPENNKRFRWIAIGGLT